MWSRTGTFTDPYVFLQTQAEFGKRRFERRILGVSCLSAASEVEMRRSILYRPGSTVLSAIG
jgi:hypothetical protein